ncbi:hypothetical protein TSTA_059780 [Talaromyces stipitatus ATCC 10500]|uniref:RNase H type-1 domain-containing protein n=1 Tax=Talaromyces stipitatus (strain ATCC 10500 / CBS 375.48 / QM 6759 / NRRL 1006) TaxID=441959 RepID=B8LTA6_TALSN|nr:uncharacterized protein TSTA_059780 [Talaromyces stipitatus ATCC 10500]EED22480.1 hypothetical protein TSTA_059780 [Talaromyces stipitatus ATCC 10500]
MAATGKSTISRTVAESFDKEQKLGASFFFKRGKADRSNVAMLFTTICAQLLGKNPSLIAHVEMVIDADPNISDKSMGEQFEKLICLHLSQLRHNVSQAQKLIIVVDALDECAEDGDTLLRLLSQTRNKWSPSLQILITSRPEQQIRPGFADIPEEASPLSSNADFPKPKRRAMSVLVKMAVPLFIFVATLCQFVEDPAWSDPTGQLKKVLEHRKMNSDSEIDKLDATYSPILNQLIHGRPVKEQKSLVDKFRCIVGTIIVLAGPLSRSSLASLLNIDSQEIEGQLSSLHSVHSVPSSADSPIRMLHLSFREFLIGLDKCHTNPFWVEETETFRTVMTKCLERMFQPGTLQENICNLQGHGTLRAEIDGRIITYYLPPDIQSRTAADYMDFQRTIPGTDIVVFSDGSRLVNGHAGGGYVTFQAYHQFLRSSLSYGHGKEVFDAEAEAALDGAQAAIAYPTARFATNLWICLDNLEVATRLLSPSTGSSQEVFESFRTLAAAWPLRERLPHTKSGSIQIRWAPGHAKNPENEAADLAAKEGAASIPSSLHKSSYASLKRYAKTQSHSAAQIQWQTVAPQTYQDLEITTSPKRPAELQLNRLDLSHIIAARTGRGVTIVT